MGSRNFRSLQCILLALTLCSPVHSDVILSAGTADAVLKELHLLAAQIHDSNNLPAPVSAIFALGIEATTLAGLLSREVAAHGEQDILLVDTTVRGAAELGVVIHWSGEHRRYYYDGAAFRQYLELAPSGLHAADCWFRIIEQRFDYSEALDRESLASAAALKQDFLTNYPSYEKADKIGIYLSIDYRDLWRGCRNISDDLCAVRYLDQAREALQGIASDYQDTNSGKIAARMLLRIEKEMGEQK